jgi:hypothetical protein
MLTRFKENITRYPRLFTAWLVGCALAVAESYVPRLVGAQYANIADLVLAVMLAGLIYRWVVRNSRRTAILLDIINRFEGRDVCTFAEHMTIDEEETFEETDESEVEPEDEEEIQ